MVERLPGSHIHQSLREMDQEQLSNWLSRALAGDPSIANFSRDVTPHTFIEVVFDEASSTLREAIASAALRLLDLIAADETFEFRDWCAHSLLMAVNPIFVKSVLREEAGAALLGIIGSSRIPDDHPRALRRLALQGLLELELPVSREFWIDQYARDPERYRMVVLAGLAHLDVVDALRWLASWPAEHSPATAFAHLLPALLSELGRDRVSAAAWRALPHFDPGPRKQVAAALEEAGLGASLGRTRRSVEEFEDLIEEGVIYYPQNMEDQGLLEHLRRLGLDAEPRKRDIALERVVARWRPYSSPIFVSCRVLQVVAANPTAGSFAGIVFHLSTLWSDYKRVSAQGSGSTDETADSFPLFLLAAIDVAVRTPGLGRARAARTREALADLAKIAVEALREGHLHWADSVASMLAVRLNPEELGDLLFDFVLRRQIDDFVMLDTLERAFRPAPRAAIHKRLARLMIDGLSRESGRIVLRRLKGAVRALNEVAPNAFAGIDSTKLEAVLFTQQDSESVRHALSVFVGSTITDDDEPGPFSV